MLSDKVLTTISEIRVQRLNVHSKVNQELLDAAGPGLRVVSTMSVGYEHLDIPLLTSRGIKIGYTPDVLTDAGIPSTLL